MRNLVVIVFLVSFLEMLTPEGAMKRFVQVVIGFFVLIMMIEPVLDVLHGGRGFLDQATRPQLLTGSTAVTFDRAAGGESPDLHAADGERAMRLARERLRAVVEAEVRRRLPDADVDVEPQWGKTGEISALTVTVGPGAHEPAPAHVPSSVPTPADQAAPDIVVELEPVRPVAAGAPAQAGGQAGRTSESGRRDEGLARDLAVLLGLPGERVVVIVLPTLRRTGLGR